jgi:hypothetical protein
MSADVGQQENRPSDDHLTRTSGRPLCHPDSTLDTRCRPPGTNRSQGPRGRRSTHERRREYAAVHLPVQGPQHRFDLLIRHRPEEQDAAASMRRFSEILRKATAPGWIVRRIEEIGRFAPDMFKATGPTHPLEATPYHGVGKLVVNPHRRLHRRHRVRTLVRP